MARLRGSSVPACGWLISQAAPGPINRTVERTLLFHVPRPAVCGRFGCARRCGGSGGLVWHGRTEATGGGRWDGEQRWDGGRRRRRQTETAGDVGTARRMAGTCPGVAKGSSYPGLHWVVGEIPRLAVSAGRGRTAALKLELAAASLGGVFCFKSLRERGRSIPTHWIPPTHPPTHPPTLPPSLRPSVAAALACDRPRHAPAPSRPVHVVEQPRSPPH